MKRILLLLPFVIICSCTPKLQPVIDQSYHGIPQVEFCNLPNHEGELVFITAKYSGYEEYWSMKSLRQCDSQLLVELVDNNGEAIPIQYRPLFDSVLSSYWKTYLIIKATGTFESKSVHGYGHLGSNKSRFIVKEYVDVQLAEKRRRK